VRVGDHHAGAAGWRPGELFSQERQFVEDRGEILAGLAGLAQGKTALGIVDMERLRERVARYGSPQPTVGERRAIRRRNGSTVRSSRRGDPRSEHSGPGANSPNGRATGCGANGVIPGPRA